MYYQFQRLFISFLFLTIQAFQPDDSAWLIHFYICIKTVFPNNKTMTRVVRMIRKHKGNIAEFNILDKLVPKAAIKHKSCFI